jgi:hypothetical protein
MLTPRQSKSVSVASTGCLNGSLYGRINVHDRTLDSASPKGAQEGVSWASNDVTKVSLRWPLQAAPANLDNANRQTK